jgi:hypothetical protein
MIALAGTTLALQLIVIARFFLDGSQNNRPCTLGLAQYTNSLDGLRVFRHSRTRGLKGEMLK